MKRSVFQLMCALALVLLVIPAVLVNTHAAQCPEPNPPMDTEGAPKAILADAKEVEVEEQLEKPDAVDDFLKSRWRCSLSYDGNIWLKGMQIVLPFRVDSYESDYGEHNEKMYAYFRNASGKVLAYYEEDYSADYQYKNVFLTIPGSENLPAGTYYLTYYSTYHAGNTDYEPLPIVVEEYDPGKQYSYVNVKPEMVGAHFDCGKVRTVNFKCYSLGYVGHEYFIGLYDSAYNLIYGETADFGYDFGEKSCSFTLDDDLRPGTYYLRAFSSYDTKNKDTYYPFYVDNRGVGCEYDEKTRTLSVFGTGEAKKLSYGNADKTQVKTIVVEDGVTKLGDYVFQNYSSLTDISLPDGLTYIGREAFSHTKLKTIRIPNSVSNIYYNAFYQCKDLQSITTFGNWQEAPKSAILDMGAFEGCTALTSLEVPSSVARVGGQNYTDLSLEGIYFQDEAPVQIGQWSFCSIAANVYYPSYLDSWTEEIMQDYGGNLTWKPYNPPLENVVLTEAVGHKTGNIIRWNASRHADLYQVYRRAANETSWTLLKNTRSLAYKDESAAVGVRYYYKVRSRNGAAMSSLDIPALSAVRAYPLDSVNMTKILGHKTGNIVYWEAVDGADLYQVFRRAESESGWTLIKNTRSLAYKDESAALGVKYYYKVRARNGDLMSSMDITALSAVRPYPLASVKMTKAVGHATGNIIYWEAVENAKLYQVYRRAADESGWTLIKNTGSLAYKDTEAQSGVKYYYKVVARNGDDRSSMDIPAVSATRP